MAKQTPEERERQRRLREATTAKRDQERRTLDSQYWHSDGKVIHQWEWTSTEFGLLWATGVEKLTPDIPRTIVDLVEFIGDSALLDEKKARAENIKRTADAAYIAPRTVQRWVAAAINPTAKETRGTSQAGRRRIWETLRGAAREAALAEIRHLMRAEGLGADIEVTIIISKDRRDRELSDIGADGRQCADVVTPAMQLRAYDTAAEEWFSLAMENLGMPEETTLAGSDKDIDPMRRASALARALEEISSERPAGRADARSKTLNERRAEANTDYSNVITALWLGYEEPNESEPEHRPYAPKMSAENDLG